VSAGLIVPFEEMGQHNPVRWEGALLQLKEFDAGGEVLNAVMARNKTDKVNCRGPYTARPSKVRR
jgi:hypothetical protein